MFAAAPSRKNFAYSKPTDMRKSFQGLLARVQRVFKEQAPHSGSLFVFVNRRGIYIKILAWDDVTWLQDPPKIGVPNAQVIPKQDGDTLWCSLHSLYDGLSEKELAELHDLVVHNVAGPFFIE